MNDDNLAEELDTGPSQIMMGFKRTLDIIVAGSALLLLITPGAVLALVIWLQDRGPPFYPQTRVGRHCQPFAILKFRSMVTNADTIGGFSTSADDPRITPLGRFIRRTSIDELPQLWNVLVGDMSIVGPRPDVPAQEGLYTRGQWLLRHRVRPGITGLAQSVARSAAGPEERTELDLTYVRTISLGLDIKIILMTAKGLFIKAGN